MIRRNIRLSYSFTQAYWQTQGQYRLASIIWILNGFITPLILMALWITVGSVNERVNNQEIVTYYLLSVLVVRMTQSWAGESLSSMIKDGRFSRYLVKPFSIFTERFSLDQSMRMTRLSTLLPFFLLVMLWWQPVLRLELTSARLVLFVVALLIGYGINFMIDCMLGMVSFWVEEGYGTFMFFMLIKDLFSGFLIPFLLMPSWLQSVSKALPFYASLGFPIDILMGRLELSEILGYLTLLGFYFVLLAVITVRFYKTVVKNYTAVGM